MAGTITIESGKVESRHWLNFRTGDQYRGRNLHFVTLSGIALPNLQGRNEDWHAAEMQLEIAVAAPLNNIPIPQPPGDEQDYQPVFMIRDWKAYAGLNAVYNEGAAKNNGQSVGLPARIRVSGATTNSGDPYQKVMLHTPDQPIVLHCSLAVRDSDAYLNRVAYQLDMLVCFAGYAERS